MRPINELLSDFVAQLEREEPTPWYGDPWQYDIACGTCGHICVSSDGFCPRCDSYLGEGEPLA